MLMGVNRHKIVVKFNISVIRMMAKCAFDYVFCVSCLANSVMMCLKFEFVFYFLIKTLEY